MQMNAWSISVIFEGFVLTFEIVYGTVATRTEEIQVA